MADTRKTSPATTAVSSAAVSSAAVSSAAASTSHAAAVAAALGGALLLTAALLAGVLVLADRPTWWRGAMAATIVSVMASLATLPIIAWGLRRGTQRPGGKPELAAAAFFAAAGVRALVGLGGGAVAVFLGGYPKDSTFLLIVPYYFAILAAETAVTARRLWNAAPATPGAPAATGDLATTGDPARAGAPTPTTEQTDA